MNTNPQQIVVKDDGVFPNSNFPVLLYKNVLDVPALFPATSISNQFEKYGWGNSWDDSIFEYHHYHSIAHEALGIYKGSTTIQLGGDEGPQVNVEKGDVLVIPAGVAHKNLGKETDIGCVGAYPLGRKYDMNYGYPGERPQADKNIIRTPIPETDPVLGKDAGLTEIWHD